MGFCNIKTWLLYSFEHLPFCTEVVIKALEEYTEITEENVVLTSV